MSNQPTLPEPLPHYHREGDEKTFTACCECGAGATKESRIEALSINHTAAGETGLYPNVGMNDSYAYVPHFTQKGLVCPNSNQPIRQPYRVFKNGYAIVSTMIVPGMGAQPLTNVLPEPAKVMQGVLSGIFG